MRNGSFRRRFGWGVAVARSWLARPRRARLPRRLPLREKLRTYLITGLLVAGPIGLTFYLCLLIVDFVDRSVAALFPAAYNPNHYLPFHIPGLGLIVAVIGLTLIGAVAAGYLGRLFVRASERVLGRMPFIRGIYGAVKQIFETVLAKQSNTFREVVLIEFPRREMWTLGFITGRLGGEIQALSRDEMVSVLIPTTPNPTSGYLVFVPRREIVPVSLSVEEGIKFVVSGGIVTPPERHPAAAPAAALLERAAGSDPAPL
ncbi:MAG: DUF502 domain-containing protein [Stellaceae bacterium]